MLLGTQEITRKISNIKQNNHVTVLVDTTDPTLKGVIMAGEAELDFPRHKAHNIASSLRNGFDQLS